MAKINIGDKVHCTHAETIWYTVNKIYEVVAHPENGYASVIGSERWILSLDPEERIQRSIRGMSKQSLQMDYMRCIFYSDILDEILWRKISIKSWYSTLKLPITLSSVGQQIAKLQKVQDKRLAMLIHWEYLSLTSKPIQKMKSQTSFSRFTKGLIHEKSNQNMGL